MWEFLWCLVIFSCIPNFRSQFFNCHDDPTYDPVEGPLEDLQFTWLGALQYIHVKNGTPHYFRVPRVILISRQFVLSTAVDAAEIPDGFALGNVVFVDYERDEEECQVSADDLASGADCAPAVLLMPIADVLLHPEYKHFGAKHSLAILKLIKSVKSKYMLPACLPFKNYITRKDGKQTTDKLYHLDFSNDVPRDFLDEDKEVSKISLLPRELCYLYDYPLDNSKFAKNRMACSTGCGFHSGAPSVVHEHTGHWSIVAISMGQTVLALQNEECRPQIMGNGQDKEEELLYKGRYGGAPCPDPLRPRRPPTPPRHVLIHPYVPWITAAITGKAVGAFAKDDPFGFVMPRASPYDLVGHGWVGHWWMGGLRCYDRGEAADDIFRFYHEIFMVKPAGVTYLEYFLEIEAAHGTMVICVKIGMPLLLGDPQVWDLDSPVVKVQIPVFRFKSTYRFQVEAWGYNTTGSGGLTSEECDSEDSDCSLHVETR